MTNFTIRKNQSRIERSHRERIQPSFHSSRTRGLFVHLTTALLFILFLSACSAAASNSNPPSASEVPTLAPTLAIEAAQPVQQKIESQNQDIAGAKWPPPTFTAMPVLTTTPPATTESTPTAEPTTAQASPTPEPYAGLAISDLVSREYGGGELQIVDTLENNDSFTRYAITYPSDGLSIHGFMNVPNEGSRFPVAIVLHGYIDPAQYRTLDYTTRYADHLAEAGYFVIHPNMRGFPPSDDGPDRFRVGLATDILNLIAIVREQSKDPLGYLRRADADDINLWGHSMGGGVVLRVITVNNAPYIRAAVLYGAMSGDELQNYEKIRQWSDGEVGEFELSAAPALIEAISPIYHLQRIKTPVSAHHGAEDDVVPPEWSDDLCLRLRLLEHSVECYTYAAMPHTFRGASDQLFMDRTAAFFDRH